MFFRPKPVKLFVLLLYGSASTMGSSFRRYQKTSVYHDMHFLTSCQ